MEKKKMHCQRIYPSIAESFRQAAVADHRGDTGMATMAAMLMFQSAKPADARAFIEAIKLAEVRAGERPIFTVACNILAGKHPR